MKKTIVFLAFLTAACTSQPPAAPPVESARMASEILYVGVPTMNVYASPNDTAPVITTYGYTETVSVLSRRNSWVEVRTVDGSGWAHSADLIAEKDVQAILGSPAPRFRTPPVTIPQPRLHGEIDIEAKVNTDGDVVAVVTTKNTTGSRKLADANAAALQQAKFYPMIQKGQRQTFIYEYDVKY